MLSRLQLKTVNARMPARLVDDFKRQAKEAFPHETLSYLIGVDAGTDVEICRLWTPENVDEAGSESQILIFDEWPVLAREYAREHDMTVLGTVHSHPYRCKHVENKASLSWDATPSEGDFINAVELGPLIAICTVTETRTHSLRSSFRLWGPMVPVELSLSRRASE